MIALLVVSANAHGSFDEHYQSHDIAQQTNCSSSRVQLNFSMLKTLSR